MHHSPFLHEKWKSKILFVACFRVYCRCSGMRKRDASLENVLFSAPNMLFPCRLHLHSWCHYDASSHLHHCNLPFSLLLCQNSVLSHNMSDNSWRGDFLFFLLLLLINRVRWHRGNECRGSCSLQLTQSPAEDHQIFQKGDANALPGIQTGNKTKFWFWTQFPCSERGEREEVRNESWN